MIKILNGNHKEKRTGRFFFKNLLEILKRNNLLELKNRGFYHFLKVN